LNPKTAAFFLAFIPQFVDLSVSVVQQFIVLGLVSVALNTAADVVVTYWAARARAGLAKRPSLVVKMRQMSGAVMCGLGQLRPDRWVQHLAELALLSELASRLEDDYRALVRSAAPGPRLVATAVQKPSNL